MSAKTHWMQQIICISFVSQWHKLKWSRSIQWSDCARIFFSFFGEWSVSVYLFFIWDQFLLLLLLCVFVLFLSCRGSSRYSAIVALLLLLLLAMRFAVLLIVRVCIVLIFSVGFFNDFFLIHPVCNIVYKYMCSVKECSQYQFAWWCLLMRPSIHERKKIIFKKSRVKKKQ